MYFKSSKFCLWGIFIKFMNIRLKALDIFYVSRNSKVGKKFELFQVLGVSNVKVFVYWKTFSEKLPHTIMCINAFKVSKFEWGKSVKLIEISLKFYKQYTLVAVIKVQ